MVQTLLFIGKHFFMRLIWIALLATFGIQLLLSVLPAKRIAVPDAKIGEASFVLREWTTNSYLNWVEGAVTGDFELTDVGTGEWEVDDFFRRMNISLRLCLTAFLVAGFLGIMIGAYRASLEYELLSGKQGSSIDKTSKAAQWTLFIFSSMPSYIIAYILFIVTKDMDFLMSVISLALGSGTAMDVARMTQNSHARQLRGKYIESAIANGLKTRGLLPLPGYVAWHAFRNSLITVLPVTALRLPLIISSSIMVEMVFDIPGIGQSLLDALIKQDIPRILSIVLFSVVFVQICVFIADFLAFILHPKVAQN